MAILAIFTCQVTKSQYDAVSKEIDWEHNPPEGVLFQAASFDNSGGIHVADVWASKEALDAFVVKKLMPALQKLKVPTPKVEIYPIHKAFAYPALEQFKVKAAQHSR